ncbi:MAG: glycosyl hydrolase [Deltaproteobacteria bacterium]|nr:glycosyl hydrolase [Deltaproteobacteria bacterium]
MLRKMYMLLMVAVMVFTMTVDGFTFQDVLETPAVKSKLAAKTLQNSITRAGARLVSVGWRGHILYSDDQGKSWIQASVPVSSDLTDVCFPSDRKGWAVGHDGVVLHSSDGGTTWTKQLDGHAAVKTMADYYTNHPLKDPEANQRLADNVKVFAQEGADKPFLGVWFDDESSGFIVGTFGLIFHTMNGGKSWEPLMDRVENPGLRHLNAVRRIGQDLFICGERGLVLKFDQKAGSFRALETPYKGTYFGMTGKPGNVVVFGMRGNVFLSTNDGSTWKKAATKLEVGLNGGTVTADGRIVLVGQSGHILISDDDGKNFNLMKMDKPIPASDVAVVNKDNLVLAGVLGLKLQPLSKAKAGGSK